jgi:hypothetical protein
VYTEEDGFSWNECSADHMVGYIAHLECRGTEGPSSIAGYISGVKFFVTSLGLQSPGLVLPGQLHPAVKMATHGFQ